MVTTSENVLQVSNLTKIYGREIKLWKKTFGKRVIGAQEVSFSVNKGEIFGFLGPNGAGKTTTIRSILHYLHPQEATISVLGLDYKNDYLDIRKRVGYIPGDLILYDNFTGEELIKYLGNFRPIDEQFLSKLKTIFKVNLKQKIKTLSKGNKQQAGLIAVLSSKPDLLILDEPTAGLDPLMTAHFHKMLKDLKAEGITIFLSSHDLAEVQAICDRVAIIKEGKIILVEHIEDIKAKFLQNVKIRFNNPVPEEKYFKEIDSIVSVEKTNHSTFTLKLKEDVNELLQVLSSCNIERLTIEDATLEEIFLQYYE